MPNTTKHAKQQPPTVRKDNKRTGDGGRVGSKPPAKPVTGGRRAPPGRAQPKLLANGAGGMGKSSGGIGRGHRGHQIHDVLRLSNTNTLRACPKIGPNRSVGRGPMVQPREGIVLRAGANLPSYFESTRAGKRFLARANGDVPAADGAVTTTRAPEVFDIVDADGNPGTRVRHSELIQDFSVAALDTAFEVAAMAINPGLGAVFPWLSQLAEAFTGYSFGELAFEYVPRLGTVNDGSVFMAPAPNVQDPPPANEEELSAYVGAAQTAVYNDFSVCFDPDSMTYGDEHDTKYVRTGLEAGDPKTFDSGQLFVASSYGPDATPVVGGGLWAHYDVELFDQKETNNTQERIDTLVSVGSVPTEIEMTGGVPQLLHIEAWYAGSPDASALTSLNTFQLQTMTTMGHAAPIPGVWYMPRGRYHVSLDIHSWWQASIDVSPATAEFYVDFFDADVGVYPDPVLANFVRSTELPTGKTFRLYGTGSTDYLQKAPSTTVEADTVHSHMEAYIEADQPTWLAVHALSNVDTGTVRKFVSPSTRLYLKPA